MRRALRSLRTALAPLRQTADLYSYVVDVSTSGCPHDKNRCFSELNLGGRWHVSRASAELLGLNNDFVSGSRAKAELDHSLVSG